MTGDPARRDERRQLEADARARRLACTEFEKPLLLEAGAGTGKTTTLVARIVCWCLGPGWARTVERLSESGEDPTAERIAAATLERVVAITFTEAAAAEMAQRVGRALGELAAGTDDGRFPEGALPAPGAERSARCRALAGALDRLVVRTIHGFCRRLLARHPIEVGLAPGFAVDADLSITTELAHEVLAERAPALFTEPESAELLARLFDDGIEFGDLEQALTRLAAADLPAERLAEPPDRDDVATLHRRLLDAARSLGGILAPLRDVRRKLKAADAARDLADLVEALESIDPHAPGSFDRIVAAAGRCEKLRPNLAELRKDPARLPAAVREALGMRVAELAPAVARLAPVLGALAGTDPALHAAARALLAPLLADLQQRLARRGVLGFDALLARAERLLRDRRIAGAVRREIDQLLVDEFQDTDALQCEIITRLALPDEHSPRPGLFVVGDAKQSIYAFRGADLEAWEGFRERVLAAGGETHRLALSFRSVPGILAEVERLIRPVMRPHPGLQPRFEPLLAARGVADGSTRDPIEHWVSWRAEEDGSPATRTTRAHEAVELEARAIAADIRQRHDRDDVPWNAFALLLRSTGDIERYLEALRAAGIPYAVTRDRQYFRRREVIDAAALLRAIIDPSDTMALVTYLRSAGGGLPDAALIPLWSAGLPDSAAALSPADPDALGRALQAVDHAAEVVGRIADEIPGLERLGDWPAAVRAALQHLAELRGAFHLDPPALFVEKLRTLCLPEPIEAGRYLGAFRLANLERLFDEILSALGGDRVDPETLLRALRRSVAELLEAEEARPEAAASDAVQVMTIHGSKGLGFEHVYLPQLHRGHGGRRRERTTEVLRRGGRAGIVLFGRPDPRALLARCALGDVALAEQVRLLYVAMTRAKDRLVLCGLRQGQRARGGSSLMEMIEPADADLDLVSLWAELREDGVDQKRIGPAVWRFPALRPAGRRRRTEGSVPPTASPDEIEAWLANADRLAAARRAAARHKARPLATRMSDEAHERLRELLIEAGASPEEGSEATGVAPGDDERVAMAAGSLVHRVLERLDLARPVTEALRVEAARAGVIAAGLAPERLVRQVAGRAAALLERMAEGPLAARLERIAPGVLGREVPLVAPPGAPDTAVAYRAGVIDLVYRDADGVLVVADYKTDDVDDEALERRALAYAPQLAAYRDGLRRALAIDGPVRAELWFLARGVIRDVP